MTRPGKLFNFIFAAVVAADQVAKFWAVHWLAPRGSVSLLGNVARLTFVRNRGAAFGLLPGNLWLLVVASVVALLVVAYALVVLPPGRRRERVALALVAGGAVGNLVDRLRMGQVVDFLDVGIGETYRWPTFNVADSAVSVGIILLLLWSGMRRNAAEPAAESPELKISGGSS